MSVVSQTAALKKGKNKMTNVYTIHELVKDNWEQLVLNRKEAIEILEVAKPKSLHYVGTHVYNWLSNYMLVDREFLGEKYGDEEGFTGIENLQFQVIYHDNSYNWNGNGNIDFDFKFLVDDNDSLYMLVKFHIGTDIRMGYTKSILLDLDTYLYSDNDMLMALDYCLVKENGVGGYVSIDNTFYSIDGDLMSDFITVYNHDTNDTIEVYENLYLWDSEEEFTNACFELVKEHLNDFDK